MWRLVLADTKSCCQVTGDALGLANEELQTETDHQHLSVARTQKPGFTESI